MSTCTACSPQRSPGGTALPASLTAGAWNPPRSYDRYLWDPVARNWTVGRYLDDLRSRYGGIDSVLVWPTYTNIGADERNQFAMIRALPGGVAGIRSLAEQFHSAGVRMLVPYHVWDVGTRREVCPGSPS